MATDFYSFEGLKEEVRLRLGKRTDISSRINDWIYSGQLMLAKSELEFPFLEIESQLIVLNEGQASYNVEALGLDDIIGVRLWRNETDDILLDKFPFSDFRALSSQASGSPSRWTRRGNVLFVDPLPDDRKDTLMDYRRQPQRDTLEFDKEWHETIAMIAVVYGWRALDAPQKAQATFAQLPAIVQLRMQQPLSQDEWEATLGEGPSFVFDDRYL